MSINQLSIDLSNGLSIITGETGAGKSIAIDALSLCLGERADANAVRKGSTKAEIIAHFSPIVFVFLMKYISSYFLRQEAICLSLNCSVMTFAFVALPQSWLHKHTSHA